MCRTPSETHGAVEGLYERRQRVPSTRTRDTQRPSPPNVRGTQGCSAEAMSVTARTVPPTSTRSACFPLRRRGARPHPLSGVPCGHGSSVWWGARREGSRARRSARTIRLAAAAPAPAASAPRKSGREFSRAVRNVSYTGDSARGGEQGPDHAPPPSSGRADERWSGAPRAHGCDGRKSGGRPPRVRLPRQGADSSFRAMATDVFSPGCRRVQTW